MRVDSRVRALESLKNNQESAELANGHHPLTWHIYRECDTGDGLMVQKIASAKFVWARECTFLGEPAQQLPHCLPDLVHVLEEGQIRQQLSGQLEVVIKALSRRTPLPVLPRSCSKRTPTLSLSEISKGPWRMQSMTIECPSSLSTARSQHPRYSTVTGFTRLLWSIIVNHSDEKNHDPCFII